jgi:hypothetical protein
VEQPRVYGTCVEFDAIWICQPAASIEIKKDAGTLISPVASGVSVVASGNWTTVGVPNPAAIFIGIVTCDIVFPFSL